MEPAEGAELPGVAAAQPGEAPPEEAPPEEEEAALEPVAEAVKPVEAPERLEVPEQAVGEAAEAAVRVVEAECHRP